MSTPSLSVTTPFHEMAIVVGIWLLVGLIGVNTLASLRIILAPLLWAFFLVMGLLPITDRIEHLLQRCCVAVSCRRRRGRKVADSDTSALDEGVSEGEELPEHSGCVRVIAVLFVVALFSMVVALFVAMIYHSALHMKREWSHYQEGARRISLWIHSLEDAVPSPVLMQATEKALSALQDLLSFLVGAFAETVTSVLASVVMTLLYMIFWLSDPIRIGQSVSSVFQQYIMLKSISSALYALCIWLLLHFLDIDLAIVFGLITFIVNFVPEVGPMFAMLLPAPVILFDSRLEKPLLVLCVATCGQLALKFVFGNIVEVNLVSRQEAMRMHPVVILFFVAFFGWIWGATGMLLSVPIVAALKTTVYMIPKTYRDPILIALEGDANSPIRYELWR
eukprot:CAMPEP_0170625416 /NCGR_PEP_ID=MMETSP0224-20130122/30744_1 /TAXON_ID=285029 /ORGANISM="Togula jolla, Strain CCCM 725" /LENGTH=391 /DNA_ID=CAMNT_0010951983 /DNA_START=42 /DNA_END=1213 /DNA_ORIENTATION=-